MSSRQILPNASANESIDLIQKEIESLKTQLTDLNYKIRNIEIQIQRRYSGEINRIRELGLLYKQQKKEKKEKRLEQRKRGKNYRKSTGLKKVQHSSDEKKAEKSNDDLRRLYREAMLKVHPDKFVNAPDEMHRRSQQLTIQLIDIYQNGDIEQLKSFHNHIMSGNAIISGVCETDNIPDPVSMKAYLLKEKEALLVTVNKLKDSRLYEVLTTYDVPEKFIDELSEQLKIRIEQLERRTRIKKQLKNKS